MVLVQPLSSASKRATLATVARWTRGRRERGKSHAQIAADHRPSGARHRPALDRSGHRRDQLAAIELHDPTAAMGRLRRRAGRVRPGPDLAEQTLISTHVMAGLDSASHLLRESLVKIDGCPDQARSSPGMTSRKRTLTMATQPFDLRGKVAIVTGGNGGIGLGMARGLAEAGAAIAVVGRNEAKSAAAVNELKQLGAKAIA